MRPAFRALVEVSYAINAMHKMQDADVKQYKKDVKAEGKRKPQFDAFRKQAKRRVTGGGIAGMGIGGIAGIAAYKAAKSIKSPSIRLLAQYGAMSLPIYGGVAGMGAAGQYNTHKYTAMRKSK